MSNRNFFREKEIDERLARKRLKELVKRGVLDVEVIADVTFYNFSDIFSEIFEESKKELIKCESYEERIRMAMRCSIATLSGNTTGESVENFLTALVMLKEGLVPKTTFRLRPEEEMALKGYTKKTPNLPSDDELRHNILQYATDENMKRFFSEERPPPHFDGIKKLQNCKYNSRCVELGTDFFSWPYISKKFLVTYVCKPCKYFEKKS
jgi:hypothetical protein